MTKWISAAVIALWIFAPAPASADWLFTPAFGTTFGADTHGREHPVFGAAIGRVDDEAFGWEIDFSFAPDFFEGQHENFAFNGDSHVATVMFNALIGVPSSYQTDARVRPYATGGVGLLQVGTVTDTPEEGIFDSRVREFGWNVAGGMTGFFSDRFGVRAEVRYFRSFQNEEPSWTRGLAVDVAPGNFDYLRAMAGVTFRFPSE
jgi:opacity protein-like surface antigen